MRSARARARSSIASAVDLDHRDDGDGVLRAPDHVLEERPLQRRQRQLVDSQCAHQRMPA
jgi:hypothetical protein